VQHGGIAQMTLPLGWLLGEDVPPMGGIPLDFTGAGPRETLGRPAIGFELGHFSILRYSTFLMTASGKNPGQAFLIEGL
jgi:hypothetical protein